MNGKRWIALCLCGALLTGPAAPLPAAAGSFITPPQTVLHTQKTAAPADIALAAAAAPPQTVLQTQKTAASAPEAKTAVQTAAQTAAAPILAQTDAEAAPAQAMAAAPADKPVETAASAPAAPAAAAAPAPDVSASSAPSAAQTPSAPQTPSSAQPPSAAQNAALPQNTARIEMPVLSLPCRCAILEVADTGDVLYEKDADEEVPIASITKVMTLLLTLEAVEAGKISLQDIVPISVHAYNMGGSQIWLEPGERFTLDELIKAICVCSANDAAVAVAEYVGGSEPVFAQMMNARAAELGMTHTHFVNACGLDTEGHYSSARDVAVMSRALMRHPVILEYSGIWTDTLRGGKTQLTNTNKLLRRYAGITGLKTGTTGKAGVCIAATATRDGMSLIAVVLGSASGEERFAAATTMLDYGFAAYEVAPFPQMPDAPAALAVKGGAAPAAELLYETPAAVLCRKGEGRTLTAACTLPAALTAPVAEGAEVGEVTLCAGETPIGRYAVITQSAVERMRFAAGLRLLAKALLAL